MRIALIVTPENPVPPTGYGGGERVADVMVRQLVTRGHEVDLYAAPGSTSLATRLIAARRPLMSEEVYLHQRIAVEHLRRLYDVVLDRAAFHLTGQAWYGVDSRYAKLKPPPVISIMAGDPFKRYPHDGCRNRVYVSWQLAALYECPMHPILPNPVCPDPAAIPFSPQAQTDNTALYVGPIHPMKGLEIAAEACAKLGWYLNCYGPPRDHDYTERLRRLPNVRLMGVLAGSYKGIPRHEEIGRYPVFVHAVQCCDADPGAPKEAAICGVPIAACPNGGIVERVVSGVTGYFGITADQLAVAIGMCAQLDRAACRAEMLRQVDPIKFGDALELLCCRAASGEEW